MKINNLKRHILCLTGEEKKELIDFIKSSFSVFDQYSNIDSCPRCFSFHFKKDGKRKGIQRYKCLDCKRYFNYKTNTILAHLQKLDKWNDFMEDFLSLEFSSLMSLKEKLHLSEQTVFNWRHKLLSSIVANSNKKFFNEHLEFDEAFFKISRKGRRGMRIKNKRSYRLWRKGLRGDSKYMVKVFFIFGRSSAMLETYESHMGRTSIENLRNYFYDAHFKKVEVISDAHPSYVSFFKRCQIPHLTFISKDHVNPNLPKVHNQTINAFMRGFKVFVNHHLRGVSSKYLNCYAKWFEFIHSLKQKLQKTRILSFDGSHHIKNHVVKDRIGLEIYRQSEVSFQYFLKSNHRANFGTCKNHFYSQRA